MSKQQITLSRIFASGKALNSLFFVDIYTYIRTYTNRHDQMHNPAAHYCMIAWATNMLNETGI